MGNALQDQLLNMGLVDKKKAAQVKKEKYKKNKKKLKNKQVEVDENKLLAEKALEEKKQRDRQLNLQREQEAQEKAIFAQIKQLIALNKLAKNSGEIKFNFQDGNKVKTLFVSNEQHQHLTQGQLAVVRTDNHYDIVPKAVAEKISQRNASVVIVLNQDNEEAIDDFYADFEVPDDLMW